jgi:hypothetical protein
MRYLIFYNMILNFYNGITHHFPMESPTISPFLLGKTVHELLGESPRAAASNLSSQVSGHMCNSAIWKVHPKGRRNCMEKVGTVSLPF